LYQKAWRAHLLGDSAELRAERAAMDTMHSAQLAIIAWIGGSSAGASRDAVAALDKMLAHAATKAERLDALALASTLFLSYGMPARAAAAAEEEAGLMDDPVPVRTWQIAAALYGSGDTTSAARAIQLLPALYEKTDARNRVDAKCMSEQWELWQGRTENFAKIESEMAAIKTDVSAIRNDAQVCALTLNVIRSMQSSSADLRTRVSALDAVMQRGPALQSLLRNVANIVLARGAERAGDKVLAYRATKRAPVHPAGWQLRDVMQRESARLAALNGDRAYAIMQYKRYLDAHEIAEPALRQQDDGARADLARLTGERR
jgi:hypothetical protein